MLQQALAQHDAITKWASEIARYRKQTESAATQTYSIRRALELLQATPLPQLAKDLSNAELRERLSVREGELPQLRAAATEAEAESRRRSARRRIISQDLENLPKALADTELQLADATPEDEPIEVAEARRNDLLARLRALQLQQEALQSERSAYDATVDLVPLQRRLTSLELSRAEQLIDRLRAAIARRQRDDVVKQLRDAREDVLHAKVEQRRVAEEAVELVETRLETQGRVTAVDQRQTVVRNQLDRLRAERKRIHDQVCETGLTQAIGQLLRRRKAGLLPDEQNLEKELTYRQAEIQSLQQSTFELEERQRQLELCSAIEPGPEDVPRLWQARQSDILPKTGVLERPVEFSYEDLRLQALDLLVSDAQAYFYELVDLDSSSRELLAEVRQYGRYIDENVLWIRDTGTFRLSDLHHATGATLWLIAPEGWQTVGQRLLDDARAHSILTVTFTVSIIVMIYFGRRANRRIIELGERANRSTAQQFTPTLQTLVLTILSALPWPLLLTYIGWRLGTSSTGQEFAGSLGTALWQTAVPFFLLLLARQTCRAKTGTGGWRKVHVYVDESHGNTLPCTSGSECESNKST